nr:alpha-L-fucosidase [Kiritimatiellia bacterium]
SWAYAWYDEYWKTPKVILGRLIGCVGRGGTYMLNIGPRSDGSVPERCQRTLRAAGEWIRRYPQVVYATDASPWGHALPWGDVTVKGNKMFLSVFEWPASGKLYLPGLETEISAAKVLTKKEAQAVKYSKEGSWTVFDLPFRAPDSPASVIEVILKGAPKADKTFGIDPEIGTYITCDFAEVQGIKLDQKRWMEKFGEWKGVYHAHEWTDKDKAVFEVDVQAPGDYNVSLEYAGEGRLVWDVTVEGGESIRNEQNSSHNYQEFPIGWISFPKAGKYKVAVSCLEGNLKSASLKAIRIVPVME